MRGHHHRLTEGVEAVGEGAVGDEEKPHHAPGGDTPGGGCGGCTIGDRAREWGGLPGEYNVSEVKSEAGAQETERRSGDSDKETAGQGGIASATGEGISGEPGNYSRD